MASGERQLRLVVPLLAETDASLLALLASELGKQRFTKLETFLSRADHTFLPGCSIDSVLCSLFGINSHNGVPYAALSWQADTALPMPAGMLRADPVHLQADMDHVLLLDSSQFALSADEAAELVSSLNSLLVDDGWKIEAPEPHRWYISGVKGVAEYSDLHMIRGENILNHMPGGELASRWRKVLNEIQMLLHAHPVNQCREQRGECSINGIWPWGGGDIDVLTRVDFEKCYGDSVVLRGLSAVTGVSHTTEASGALGYSGAARLVLLPALHDPTVQAMLAYLQDIENNWVGKILDMLKRGELDSCQLFLGGANCFSLNRGTRGRWWRRKKTLFSQISPAERL